MVRLASCWITFCVWGCFSATLAFAQLGGSRAGQEGYVPGVPDMPLLQREVAQSYITVEGRAEIRLPPTELRIVLALTSEGQTAGQCRQAIRNTADKLRTAWSAAGIPKDAIVEDFIALLPRYEWTIEERGGLDVAVEQLAGYRMQTNLHLAVPGEPQALTALDHAFEQGVTGIIGFDYGSKELDAAQQKAREQALAAAQNKAQVLLGPLFETRPPVINVQEQTTVRYPESLYHSFQSSYEQVMTPAFRRDLPLIRAPRPQNTYYRGLQTDSDVRPQELPMRPEISVVSTVRLYYRSPATAAAPANDGS